MKTEKGANKASLDELREQALKHYEEASNAIHHWSSFVENAIKNYVPEKFSVPDNRDAVIEKQREIIMVYQDEVRSIHDMEVSNAVKYERLESELSALQSGKAEQGAPFDEPGCFNLQK